MTGILAALSALGALVFVALTVMLLVETVDAYFQAYVRVGMVSHAVVE